MNATLNSGYTMPLMGFGTSGITETGPLFAAIKNGYRHIDTATRYANE